MVDSGLNSRASSDHNNSNNRVSLDNNSRDSDNSRYLSRARDFSRRSLRPQFSRPAAPAPPPPWSG